MPFASIMLVLASAAAHPAAAASDTVLESRQPVAIPDETASSSAAFQSARPRPVVFPPSGFQPALNPAVGPVTNIDSTASPSFEPVDQSVADMDALGTSLRQVETGLRPDGEQTSLFRLVEPRQEASGAAGPAPANPARPLLPAGSQGPNVYYRVAPGVVTRTDRLEYLVRVGEKKFGLNIQPRRDGEFIELPSANTVFELNPWPADGAQPQPGSSHPAVGEQMYSPSDPRLDYRVDTRIDTRIGGAPSAPAPGS